MLDKLFNVLVSLSYTFSFEQRKHIYMALHHCCVCEVRGSVANQSILYGYYILCSTPSAATKHLACKMTNSLCPCVYLELHTKFVASYFILWTAFSFQTLQANIIILLGMTKTSLVVCCLPVFIVWSSVCGCCDICKKHLSSYVGAQNFDTKTPQKSLFANLRWRSGLLTNQYRLFE